MGACCGSTLPEEKNKKAEMVNDEDYKKNAHIAAVPFDVVVPASNNRLEQSMSLFDASMRHDGGAGSFIDGNMSFTNNFTDVNKSAVNKFLNNITSIVNNGDMPISMLDESLSLGSSQRMGGSMQARYSVSQEDNQYINAGADFKDKVTRLRKVEASMRRNLYGSWRMNFTLIQLAFMRIVPTLRFNPRAAIEEAASAASGGQGAGAGETTVKSAKPPVLVMHATEMRAGDFDEALQQLEDCSSLASMSTSGAFTPPSGNVKEGSAAAAAASPASHKLSFASSGALNPEASLGSTSKVEHYEMLALTCRDIANDSKVATKVVDDTWDFLSKEACVNALNGGACCFRFMCLSTSVMDKESLTIMDTFINVSSFADEEKENNCPKINIFNPDEASLYIGLMVKAMYMLPGVKISDVTPELLASMEYQRACQPGSPKLESTERPDTFRLVMTIIKFVFSITIQFKVCEVKDPALLNSFKIADGMVPAKVIMLERTKRNIAKTDATAKVRSMLLYYVVNGGLLCNSHTFILNTSLPNVVSKLVNTFGAQGASSSAETAKLTRKYLIKRFGDSRGK